MSLTLILTMLAAAGTYLATRAPTEGELVSSFQEAQRFYAEGAYDQAIAEYSEVSRVRSRVLEVDRVQVVVDEESYPLQEAAAYQIGNAWSKLYEEYDRFAAESRSAARRAEYRALADSSFALAIAAFRRVISTAGNEILKVQAHGRLIDLYFTAEDYPDVIIASREMIAAHPDDPHVIVAYYNTGWAYYETGRFARAIESFQNLLARFSTGYRADRSLFQIGECHREREEYEEAIAHYRRLVERQRIGELTDEELLQMKREKLAGLVDETALELAAKAEIRVGTCLASLGRFDEGLQAYQRVIDLFSTERQLVEEAYLRMADLHQARGDETAALRTYRVAIDESQDRTLRARIQYALAERLFSQGGYERAIQEYRIYLQGYGDIALGAGFSEGRVRYRVGSSYQQLAQPHLQAEDGPGAASWLDLAIAQYDTLCADAASPYFLDARFNRAVAYQSLGTSGATARARGEFEAIIDEGGDELYVQRALGQLADLLFDLGDYEGAVARSRQLLREYPETDFADEAHMRIGLAHQASGNWSRRPRPSSRSPRTPPSSSAPGRAPATCSSPSGATPTPSPCSWRDSPRPRTPPSRAACTTCSDRPTAAKGSTPGPSPTSPRPSNGPWGRSWWRPSVSIAAAPPWPPGTSPRARRTCCGWWRTWPIPRRCATPRTPSPSPT